MERRVLRVQVEPRAVRALGEQVHHRGQVAHREVVEVVVHPQPRGQVVRVVRRAPREQVLLREPREKPLNILEHHHHQ